MKALIPLIFLAFLATPAMAETKRQAAERVVQTKAVQTMINRLISERSVQNSLTTRRAKLPPDQQTLLDAIVSEEVAQAHRELTEAVTRGTSATYTVPQMQALADFLSTPEGRAILLRGQSFAQALLIRVGPITHKARQKIRKRLREEVPAE